MKRMFVFLLGTLLGTVLMVGALLIGNSQYGGPDVPFPYHGTVLLYPKAGEGLVMGVTSRHATDTACAAWLQAAKAQATSEALGQYYLIGECR